MERIERIGAATLYLGDCREILPTLGKIDAVVTDPPYGQNYRARGQQATGKGLAAPGVKTIPTTDRFVVGDETPFDPQQLLALNVPTLLWGAHKFFHRLPPGSLHVWDKRESLGSNSFGDCEIAWLNADIPSRVFRHLWMGLIVKAGSAEASRQMGTSAQERRLHPTQKPLALMHWSLSFVGGRRVVDPYMGSGTTGVAAAKLGLWFIGIEICETYFDIACKRIEEVYRQPDMLSQQPS